MQTPPVRLPLPPGTTAHQLMAQGMPESSAYRVLKQAGETLPWIALGKQIDADTERLRGLLDVAAKRLAERRTLARSDDERRRFEAAKERRARRLEERQREEAQRTQRTGVVT